MREDINPWIINASEVKYDNPWIRVTEHDVTNPSGEPGIYGVVHFKNLAVGVVPYEDGKIWLVGQYRVPLDAYSWEIPEGGGPQGEDSLDAAKRELLEETGLTANEFRPILEMDLSNSVSDEKAIVYLATGLSKGDAMPDSTEELQIKQMSLEDAYAAVERREIRDSLTVGAIYKMMILKYQGDL